MQEGNLRSQGGGIFQQFHQVPGPKSPTKATGHGTCFIHICNLVVPLESSKIFKSGRKFGQKLGVFWQNFGLRHDFKWDMAGGRNNYIKKKMRYM